MPAGVDPEYAREIGQAIATARKARGLTQEQLRILVGNSKNAVSNWERGASVPTVQNVRELCRVLEVASDDLLGLRQTTGGHRGTDAAEDAQSLAARLTALRRAAEQAAPDLITALRDAEREARRIADIR